MEQSVLQYKEALRIQLRDEYGKVTYTYTCFNKYVQILKKRENIIKITQIVLSSISTVGLISILSIDCLGLKICSTIISAILLCLTLYTNQFRLSDDIRQFTQGADELWKIRETYISLLTDLCQLDVNEIVKQRDILIDKTDEIYRKYPKTNSNSYKQAQKALKEDEEQFFSDAELDLMLPKHLRITIGLKDKS